MSDPLKGKVALITGASSGIGSATAQALVANGAHVSIVARRHYRLQELREKMGEPNRVLPIAADISDPIQAADVVSTTVEQWGRLDILVNNAGIMLLGPFEDVDILEWQRMVNVNLLGAMYCTHAAIPHMKNQKTGHIVNLSSVAGRRTKPNSAVYNATKWGLGAFSDALRQSLLQHQIRVTVIEPGAVATELTDHIPHEKTQKEVRDYIGSITPLTSEDIANSILYAVSQPAHVNVNEILIRPSEQLA